MSGTNRIKYFIGCVGSLGSFSGAIVIILITQQVIMADKIFETLDHNSIQALTQKIQTKSDYATQICQLEDKIESLQKDFNRSRSRNNSAGRNRSSSRSTHRTKPNPNHCCYHQRYRGKAIQ